MMKKDSVEMICSVGELAGLFEKSSDLESFLQTVVNIIAFHMKTAVCSIYLYEEETQELVLHATQGLKADSVGRVRMKIGEGLTGLAVKELRPICEGRGSQNPNYKFFPNIEEEMYEAFLAVPITHGLRRVGALVVQDPSPDYFNVHDEKALRAIAAQLASTIENAELLMGLHVDHVSRPSESLVEKGLPQIHFIKGKGVSQGVACGRVLRIRGSAAIFLDKDDYAGVFDIQQFEAALVRSEDQLERLQTEMEERMMDVASLIFSAQLLMMKDKNFSGAMRDKMGTGTPVTQAVVDVVNDYIRLFDRSTNERLREKIQDLKDLGLRILQNLQGDDVELGGYEGHIIVGRDVLPSDMLKFAAQGVAGILMLGSSGVTAHASILARSLELPMVVADATCDSRIHSKMSMVLDANQGTAFLDPSEDVLKTYRPLCAMENQPAVDVDEQTFTADGMRVKLLANINLVSDLAAAHRYKAEGVGLYRSEFPFVVRTDFPSEEEQYPIYRRILTEMEERPVVFRTLDIGGDKMLDYFPHMNEANPFLGLRAIRFSLRYKEIFCQQLRALLRAGDGYALSIMFPLVASVDDFEQARDVVNECLERLAEEGVAHNRQPRLGVMVELPSVVEVIEELAQETDFMSIGSNDLIQYMLAVDRTNNQISDLYMPFHPAVLRTVNRVARAAQKYNVPLSICGDMATEEKLVPFLLGIGVRQWSMDPHAIPRIQQRVKSLTQQSCSSFAQRLLAAGTIREITTLVENAL